MKGLLLIVLGGCWGSPKVAAPVAPKPAPSARPTGIVMVAHANEDIADRALRWVDLDAETTGELPQSLGRAVPAITVAADRIWYFNGEQFLFHRPTTGPGLTATKLAGGRLDGVSREGTRAVQHCLRGARGCLAGPLSEQGFSGEQPISQGLPENDAEIELIAWLATGRLVFRQAREHSLWYVDSATGHVEDGPSVRMNYFDSISDDGRFVAGDSSVARNEYVVTWEELGKPSVKKSALTFTSSNVDCMFARGSHTLLCVVGAPVESDYDSPRSRRIVAIDLSTATSRDLTNDMAYSNPVFMKSSPDGKYVAYPARIGPERQEVFVVEIATAKKRSLGVVGRYEHVVGWLSPRADR
jgi:hypothetical protein